MNQNIWESDDPRRFKFVRLLVRVASWFPVVLILGITLWGYYAYVIVLCLQILTNGIQRIFYLFIIHILLILYTSTYLRAIYAKHKYVPFSYHISSQNFTAINENEKERILEEHIQENNITLRQRNATGGIRYCNKCECIKPDRAYHCSACNRCILKMDHHCPWINNCCGYSNYKYFILFVNYACLICAFIIVSGAPYCVLIFIDKRIEDSYQKYNILVLVLLCVAFSFSTGMLGIFHIYISMINSSTLEQSHRPMINDRRIKNPYSQGVQENLKMVFGRNFLLAFIPYDNRTDNGYEYKLNPKIAVDDELVNTEPDTQSTTENSAISREITVNSIRGGSSTPPQQQDNGIDSTETQNVADNSYFTIDELPDDDATEETKLMMDNKIQVNKLT